jgi:two-component system aerobic respiration control sensor histidine kinase ArcB
MRNNKKRILLVEDNEIVVKITELRLRDNGYDVDVAMTGGEAICKIDTSKTYDMILLDIGLPDMSGFDVAKHVRNNSKQQGVSIIVVSATNHDQDKIQDISIDAYMTKPLDINELDRFLSVQYCY